MNRFRYVDRKILCKYDLNEDFFKYLGLKVNDMIPLRKVFVLFTDKGKKILKIIDSSKERVEFINKSLDYIKVNYPYVLQYHKNSDGEIITSWRGNDYIVLDMIEGREANFTNPIEVSWCSQSIANMHKASEKLINTFNKEVIEQNSNKIILNEYINDLQTIEEFKLRVSKYKYKNKFDSLFLGQVDKSILEMNNAMDLLQNSDYEKIYFQNDKKVLCHNDLAHHNFILDDKFVNLIDFDYCDINIRINDIYNFTSKVLKTVLYDKEVISNIINSYNSISNLDKKEIDILFALLSYPKDFTTIVKSYYLKEKQWEEEIFENRLEDKIELDIFRNELIGDYNSFINNIYN